MRSTSSATASRWPTSTSTSSPACSAAARARRPGLVRFRRSDYLGDPAVPLADAVRALVAERPGSAPDGPDPPAHAPAHASGTASTRSASTTASSPAASASRRSSPRSRTRPGASATPTCCRATDGGARARAAASTSACTCRRSWAWTSATPGARRRPGATLSVHIENREDGAPRLRRDARPAPRAAHPPRAWPRHRPLPGGHAARCSRSSTATPLALKLKGVPVHPHPEAAGMTDASPVASCSRCWRASAPASSPSSRASAATCSARARPQATVHVRSPARLAACSLRGGRGLAEAYARRPVGLARPRRRDPRRPRATRSGIDASRRRLTPAREPVPARARGVRCATRRERSREDIAAHYDLGNDLFELMLDPTMMYSCALFEHPRHDARGGVDARSSSCVCDEARPRPGRPRAGDRHRLGRLRRARRAHARLPRDDHDDLRASSTTSPSRACARPALEDRVDGAARGLPRPARRATTSSSRIEMIEAVGWKDFGTFFARCSDLLAPDGAMLLQAITMDDRAYEVEQALARASSARSSSPTAACPRSEVIAALRRARDRHAHGAPRGPHAALRRDAAPLARERRRRTPAARRARLRRALPPRCGGMYLCYCEAGFAEQRIGLVQAVLAKPRWRGVPGRWRRRARAMSAAAG